MSGTRTKIRCSSCKKHIRAHEPDLVLEDLSKGGRLRYFHESAAQGPPTPLRQRGPCLYRLVVRHVDEGVN
jgi:hypothetical protein